MSSSVKSSGALIKLIGTLSQAEKRHIILFLKRNKSESNLLLLFDLLIKGKDGKALVPNYFVTANHLYENILESLKLFHAGNSIESLIRGFMADAELLLQRSLYDQSAKKIDKAMKLAREYEKKTLEFDLIELSRKVRHRQELLDDPKGILKKELDRQLELTGSLRVRAAYRYYAYETFGLSRKEAVVRDQKRMQVYDDLLQLDWFQSEDLADSFQAKIDLYNCLGIFYRAKKEFDKLYETRKKIMDLLDEYPSQVKEIPGIWLSSVNNMIIACFHNRHFDEGFKFIQMLKKYHVKNEDERLRIFVNASSLELGYYDHTKDYEGGAAAAKKIETELTRVEARIGSHNRLALWFNLATIYFRSGQLKKSTRCLDNVINERTDKFRLEILGFSRILQMMVFVEMEDFGRLKSLVRSSERYLDKTARLFLFEKAIVKWFQKVADAGVINRGVYADLLDTLEELERSGKSSEEDDIVGIKSWLRQRRAG